MFTEEQEQGLRELIATAREKAPELLKRHPDALAYVGIIGALAQELDAATRMLRANDQAILWLRRRGVGELSACTIFDHFVLGRSGCPFAPTDRSDVARCVRLLEQPFAKGWKERMPEMATYKPWSSTALLWYEIEAHYRQTKAEGVADFAFDAKLSNLLNRS